MKKNAAMMLLLALALAVCASALADCAQRYAAAKEMLSQGRYAEASKAFRALGAYEDATVLSMYSAALALGESGQYSVALQNLQSLDGFRDCAYLVPYYRARAMEELERYEEAQELLAPISLFKDSDERLSGYPSRINARDYAKAEALERTGRLEEAYAAFLKLGTYSGSESRAEAVLQAIHARDYAAAVKLEQQGNLEEAYAAFLTLGMYSDSESRAGTVLQAIHIRDYAAAESLKAAGKLADAYDAYLSLCGYSDSREKAAAIHDPAIYEKGLRTANAGKYREAYGFFSALGAYEDSERKAYIFSVANFAEELKPLDNGIFGFRYKNVWGLVNWNENTIKPALWGNIESYQSNGLARVRSEINGLFGCIDRAGETVISAEYVSLGQFNRYELAKVQTHDGYGYIDASGKTIIACCYAGISDYRDGLCIAATEKKEMEDYNEYTSYSFSLLNETGTVLTSSWRVLDRADNAEWTSNYNNKLRMREPDFSKGFVMVQDVQGLWSMIDRNGKELCAERWAEITEFSEGLMAVRNIRGVWGYIDEKGNTIIAPEFSDAAPFSEGYAAVSKNGKIGYINRKRENLTEFLYDRAGNFKRGQADVYLAGEGWHILGTNGANIYFQGDNVK